MGNVKPILRRNPPGTRAAADLRGLVDSPPPPEGEPAVIDPSPSGVSPWWARGDTLLGRSRQRRRGRFAVAAATVAIAAGLGAMLIPPPQAAGSTWRYGTTINPSVAQLAHGCTASYVMTSSLLQAGDLPANIVDVADGPRVVPVSGLTPATAIVPGAPVATGDAATPANLLALMRTTDAMVIYHSPAAAPTDVAAASAWAGSLPAGRVFVAPWPVSRTPLPGQRALAFGSWGATQACQTFDASVADSFRAVTSSLAR